MVTAVGMGGIPIMRLRKSEAVRVVRGVLDLGVNFIDTAYIYQDSEEKIGEAIRERNKRDLVIASKSPADDRKTILRHIAIGLERLGVDYLDVYQLHGVSQDNLGQRMGRGGAYEGLVEARKQGKVKHLGFSTHNMEVAKELLKGNIAYYEGLKSRLSSD
jgi:predicted aldo/keto reductase-like oxidoreductase